MSKRFIVGIALFLIAQTAHAGYLPCPDSYLSTADSCPSGAGGWVKFPTGARFCSTGYNASNYCYSGSPGTSNLTFLGTASTDTACIQMVSGCGVRAPGGLTARGKTSKITVSWDSSGGGTSYTLKRGTVSGTYGTTVASGITARTYDDITALNGTRYYYVVAATNTYGTSANSTSVASAYALAKPTLSSAVAGNAQVTLTWATVTNAAGYTIKRATAPGGPYSSVATGITGTSYIDTSPANDTTYYYVVSATHGTGPSESDNSAERSATPRPPIPAAPTGLTATAGNAQVSLSWVAPQYAASYTVLRSQTNGGGYVAIPAGTDITTTSFTDTGLANDTTYYYVVKAKNTGGTSPNSAQVSATPIAAPAAPANLVGNPGNLRANLSWDASPGATGYSVKRRSTPTGAATTVVVGNVTSYSYTPLTNGTLYYFTVVATNSSGTSPESNQVSVTPIAPPSAPTGLVATPGDGQVSLAWNAVSGATSYDITRRVGATGLFISIASSTTASYTDTGLTNGTTYYYIVKATNAGGASGNSSTVSATPQVGAPAAPLFLTVTAGTRQIILGWNPSEGAASYTIQRATVSGGPYATIVTGHTATDPELGLPSYTNTGLADGTKYYYVVIAVNAGGSSPKSAEISATTIPGIPTGLTATAGDNQVLLSWTATPGALGYTIRRRETSGGAATDINLGNITSFTDTGLANGTLYYYSIIANNNAGSGGESGQVSVTPIPPPAAPTNFRAVPGNAQITLSWNASQSATSYKLIRSLTPNGATTTIVLGNVTSRVDSPLINGTAYYYFVVAVNGSGTSPKSLQVSATPQVPSSIVLTLAPTPSRCSQKTTPSSPGMVEIKGSLAVSGGYPPYSVVWTPAPQWQAPAGAPLPFLATFRYPGPVETFATIAPFPAITAKVTDAAGGTANVSRNLVPCPASNACYVP